VDVPVDILGVVTPQTGEDLPSHLRRFASVRELPERQERVYLLDLRPRGSPCPEDLPANVVWITPEQTRLLEMLCRRNTELLRYMRVVESARDAVVTINEDHRILFFNRAAEAMFGFSKGEVIGEDLNLIIPPLYREKHREFVQRYVTTRKGRFIDHTVELTAQRRSGAEFPIRISFSVAEEGGQLLMTAMIRDISEIKTLEKRVLQNERLASIGRALSYVTHEVKNPLTVIGGFARHLQRLEQIQGEDRHRLDIIVNEVKRLETLLQEIQDFNKPLQMEREPVHLAPVVEQLAVAFADCEEYSGIEISPEINGDPVVLADPDRLRQVLLNLIKNAVEAIPEQGRIDIRVAENSERVIVEIRDSGKGITVDRLDTIFEPFVTTKQSGSGLGLPLCRKIVQDHDGSLDIESEPGRGTCVRVTLPAAPTS
jgi:two-component system sensor kinase FixL